MVYTTAMFELFQLPFGLQLTLAFFFGVVIGSFLNVVIYRLHTNKSLSGRSHCLSCGHTLAWYDLLPLLSYLTLRGRCRYCGAYITPRYFLVELLTGLLFVSVVLVTDNFLEISFWWLIMSVLMVVLVYDLRHLIIPDRMVVLLFTLALMWVGYVHLYPEPSWVDVAIGVGAATLGASAFALLWLVSQGRWIGLGDAKLALPLGMLLGAGSVFSLLVLSFWIGAVISVAILLAQYLLKRGQIHLRFLSRPLTIKSEVPFAPFLIAAFVAIYWFELDVLSLTAAWF